MGANTNMGSIFIESHKRDELEKASVKTHSRRTKTGKVVLVHGHRRHVENAVAFAQKRITNKKQAKEVVAKYKDYPSNLDIMVNGKWKDVVTEKTDSKGKVHKVLEKHLDFTNQQWTQFIKDNDGLVRTIVNKFSWNKDHAQDLKSVATKALFEAGNKYNEKYDPSNPPDIQKHLQNHISGQVRAELTNQVATRFRLPAHKADIYNKFIESYQNNGGDYNKIYEDLGLKKKDLYPAIDKEQSEQPLPKEGYTSALKEGVAEKKTKDFERKVNELKDKYDHDKAGLDGKMHGEKAMSKEQHQRESDSLEGKYKMDLKEAKKSFDADLDKTQLQGANELFRELETIMGIRDVNMSSSRNFEDSEKPMEEIVRTTDQADPEHQMVIKTSMVHSLQRFNQHIDSLDTGVAKILRMHLGLDSSNQTYPHGLYGEPMSSVKEIANNLPKGFYKTADAEGEEVKKWQASKPKQEVNVKSTPEEKASQDKKLENWKKHRELAQKEIADKIGKVEGVEARRMLRDKVYDKHKANDSHKPTWFGWKRVKLSTEQYQDVLDKWKAKKPKVQLSERQIADRVTRDLDYGKRALNTIVPTKVMRAVAEGFADMRKYGIRKAHLKEDLIKSLVVDNFLGFKVLYEDDSFLVKAWNKVRSYFG